jgi:hypothetical protein
MKIRACHSSRIAAGRRSGIMLVDCLVYIALLALILGLAFAAFYRTLEHSTRLNANAADIARALRAGEQWRDDVRAATGPPRVATQDGRAALSIPQAIGEIIYRVSGNSVVRETAPGGAFAEVLPDVRRSEFVRDAREYVTAWRWELELSSKQEVTRVRPMFTFQAVPARKTKP